MPATTFPEYARSFTAILDTVVATSAAVLVALQVDQRSVMRGFIYQDTDNNLIFRYNNAAHRPALPQPEHKHTRSAIELVRVPNLTEVLDEILRQTN